MERFLDFGQENRQLDQAGSQQTARADQQNALQSLGKDKGGQKETRVGKKQKKKREK